MTSGLPLSTQLRALARAYPPYSEAEEDAVTTEHFVRDHGKWKELMVLHNLRFCFAFSKKFFSRAADSDDVAMLAIEGMWKATDKFDPSKGYRFNTFSTWHILASLSSILSDNRADVKMNALTASILDNPVFGKNGTEGSTIANFIEHMKSPDDARVDPSAHWVSEFSNRDFNDLINHLCGLILKASSKAKIEHRERMSNILNAFRMKFGCSGLGEVGLSNQEIAERLGVSIWSVADYIKEARKLLTDAFENGVVGTEEYTTYNCIREIFKKRAVKRTDTHVSNLAGKVRFVRDAPEHTDGLRVSRGRIRSSSHSVVMLLDGSDTGIARRRRKKLTMHCIGIPRVAPAPWMSFPQYPDVFVPEKYVAKRVRSSPDTCLSCAHHCACSSWFGGFVFCGSRLYKESHEHPASRGA